MTQYLVSGRPIYQVDLVDIVEQASLPRHRRYVGDERDDYYRNLDLLGAFEGQAERTAAELAVAFHAQAPRAEWSEHFNALRAGETMQWGAEHGIVQFVGYTPHRRWRLVHREMQFELVGPEIKQRAIRVRGLSGEAARVATKLWQREQKRRERARLRAIKRFKPIALQQLDEICRRDPDRRIDGIRDLRQFAIGEHRTFAACRELIEDSLDDFGRTQIYWLTECLKPIVRELPPEPPKPTAEQMDALEDLYL